MKFAKELEQELVPEWRAKYLNYKVGKKKLKAVARALRNAEQSNPWTPGRRARGNLFGTADEPQNTATSASLSPLRRLHSNTGKIALRENSRGVAESAPATERLTVKSPILNRHRAHSNGYGSLVQSQSPTAPSALELPAPALDPQDSQFPLRADNTGKAPHGNDVSPAVAHLPRPRRNSNPDQPFENLRRMFSRPERAQLNEQTPADAFLEVRVKDAEFFNFLDQELAKIESFYKVKETEASERLAILKRQLHLMHDAKLAETKSKKPARDATQSIELASAANGFHLPTSPETLIPGVSLNGRSRNSGALSPKGPGPVDEDYGDYVRRRHSSDVPYRSAKRKLKLALLEFYRGLELLKSYADMNRKAFRKMNKKYDKVANARPMGRYMSEKVNKAWFVQSEILDNHLVVVEDLYTRYFEQGNRKAAVGKLRGRAFRLRDYSANAFRNGLLLAIGVVLGLQGLYDATEHLSYDADTIIRSRTSYLLQIYAGYLLIVVHFLFFCLDCRIWSASKINHTFVFEFDTRHVLDWRELAELPCFFVFLEGLFVWLNFHWINGAFLYLPILLICITVVILFVPLRILQHRTRKWWAYSNWRLLFSGVYPVEFRDFFLGDMYCSQTYAMGNISLFTCLYSNSWNDPSQCNSSHSRLLGFLTTLPSIWRAFQCLRRYHDTKDVFPHIVNFTKYTFSMLYMMTLSLYRVDRSRELRGIFIFCALTNAIYSSAWDLAMDWSLGNPYSKNPFLRDFLAFQHRWVYYVAMIIDPILRFSWIFYIIFAPDVQHSALVTFIISFVEVFRRGVWSIFRVENEHCTNVCRFRASRDVPLPYDMFLPSHIKTPAEATHPEITIDHDSSGPAHVGIPAPRRRTGSTSVDVEHIAASSSLPARHRPPPQFQTTPTGTFSRVGTLLATAHAQDFERRRSRPMSSKASQANDFELPRHEPDSSTEDEGDDDDEYEEYGDNPSI